MSGVVPITVVAQKDLLAALRNHAKGQVGHAVNHLCGQSGAEEVQAFQRLNPSILVDGSCNTLDQLVLGWLAPGGLHAVASWEFTESIVT